MNKEIEIDTGLKDDKQKIALKHSILIVLLTSFLTTAGTFLVGMYQSHSEKDSWLFKQEYSSRKTSQKEKEEIKDFLIEYHFKQSQTNSKLYSLNFENMANAISPVYPDEVVYVQQMRISKELKSVIESALELETGILQKILAAKSKFGKEVSDKVDALLDCKVAETKREDSDAVLVEFIDRYKSGDITKSNYMSEYTRYALLASKSGSQDYCQDQYLKMISAMSSELSPNQNVN